MRVLLLQPRYTYEPDVPLVVQMPIGLCYLAAVAKGAGHEVGILDCLAEGYRQKRPDGERLTYGLTDPQIIRRIRDFAPQVVGISCLFSIQYPNAEALARLVKAVDPKITVVFGGIHATIRPEQVLDSPAVDYVLRGEADFTFTELLDTLAKGGDVSTIEGVGYRGADGKPVIAAKTAYIQDLDTVPFPARELLDIEAYWRAGLVHKFNLRGRRNFNIVTSRGCPAPCTFCTISQVWGKQFRARSPENVVAELRHLKKTYNANHVQFEDDNLTFDVPRAKILFQQMIDADLGLKWNTPNGVAAWRMDDACLDLMKAAGCYFLIFAVESGNQEVLTEIIKKPQRLDDVTGLIRYARRIGLKVGAFFVVGFPGETRAQIQQSFDYPHKVHLDWVEYAIATPYWGTALRTEAQAAGQLVEDHGDNHYARRGSISTEDFTYQWLEKKVVDENRRYLKFMALNQPIAFASQGWEVFKSNPSFVARYVLRILAGGRSTRDTYLPQHQDWDGA